MSATGNKGFTLIELLVVLTILVLMAGLFPLALNRTLPGRKAEAAAQTLVSALRYAQSSSIIGGRDVSVNIDRMKIDITSPARSWSLPAEARFQGSGSGVESRQRVTFFPDGSSDGAVIQVRAGSRSRLITVSGLTGRITVDGR